MIKIQAHYWFEFLGYSIYCISMLSPLLTQHSAIFNWSVSIFQLHVCVGSSKQLQQTTEAKVFRLTLNLSTSLSVFSSSTETPLPTQSSESIALCYSPYHVTVFITQKITDDMKHSYLQLTQSFGLIKTKRIKLRLEDCTDVMLDRKRFSSYKDGWEEHLNART